MACLKNDLKQYPRRIMEFGGKHRFCIEFAMAEDRSARRSKLREEIAELKNTALTNLNAAVTKFVGKDQPPKLDKFLSGVPRSKNQKLKTPNKKAPPLLLDGQITQRCWVVTLPAESASSAMDQSLRSNSAPRVAR